MYGRYIGYYNIKSIFNYAFTKSILSKELDLYLPSGKKYLFRQGREAIYCSLMDIKSDLLRSNYVALPAWGCPIVLAAVSKAGFTPLLFDVSAQTLQMDISEIIQAKKKFDISAAILIAENGIAYSASQVKQLQKSGIKVISDYALAWQNLELFKETADVSDYSIFSGGFSKPVSGLELGVLVTNRKLNVNYKPVKNDFFLNVLKLKIHILLQNKIFYGILKKFIPMDLQKEFSGIVHKPLKGSLNVVLQSLVYRNKMKKQWLKLQSDLLNLLKLKGSVSPSLRYEQYQQNKILIEKKLLSKQNLSLSAIEFHQQYRYDLLTDPRIEKGSKNYNGTKKIREEYLSFAINLTAVKNGENFLHSLRESLKSI